MSNKCIRFLPLMYQSTVRLSQQVHGYRNLAIGGDVWVGTDQVKGEVGRAVCIRIGATPPH